MPAISREEAALVSDMAVRRIAELEVRQEALMIRRETAQARGRKMTMPSYLELDRVSGELRALRPLTGIASEWQCVADGCHAWFDPASVSADLETKGGNTGWRWTPVGAAMEEGKIEDGHVHSLPCPVCGHARVRHGFIAFVQATCPECTCQWTETAYDSKCRHCELPLALVGGLLVISEASWKGGGMLHSRDWCEARGGKHEV